MSIQLRKLRLLIQHFMILQLRHAIFITQSLKEIYSGRETGLIDTGPLIKPKGLYVKFVSDSPEFTSLTNLIKPEGLYVKFVSDSPEFTHR